MNIVKQVHLLNLSSQRLAKHLGETSIILVQAERMMPNGDKLSMPNLHSKNKDRTRKPLSNFFIFHIELVKLCDVDGV